MLQQAIEPEIANNQWLRCVEIARAVCLVTGVDPADFFSHRRKRQFCEARHIFFWVCRKYTTKSFPQIGRFCGDRDHSTVAHGVQKVDSLYPYFEERIVAVLDMLGVEFEVTA